MNYSYNNNMADESDDFEEVNENSVEFKLIQKYGKNNNMFYSIILFLIAFTLSATEVFARGGGGGSGGGGGGGGGGFSGGGSYGGSGGSSFVCLSLKWRFGHRHCCVSVQWYTVFL